MESERRIHLVYWPRVNGGGGGGATLNLRYHIIEFGIDESANE